MRLDDLTPHLPVIREGLARFGARWPAFDPDPTLAVDENTIDAALEELLDRLQENYPFHHPHYAGQMLKPPHPVAVLGYLAAMPINPNNHALDGGPATARLEQEAVGWLAGMVGWDTHLGHLTSGGTVANLEALWVARELRPGRAVAASADAHYTHQRMCQVLGVPFVPIRTDDRGRMDVDDLVRRIRDGEIGTVVGTLGVTGLGALDPLPDVVAVAREHDLRVHVDAAYGGFFRLIADDGPDGVARAPYGAMAEADSVVIDPHKHGLQPYGCGSVLFRDPSVGRFYKHDSPYNYFTSDELHLGEITLECSRPGAAAAALWMTLTCLPLAADHGFGPILRRCRRAALEFADLIGASDRVELGIPPELDIVTYVPRAVPFSATAVSDLSGRLFTAAMSDPTTPVYLSKLRLSAAFVAAQYPELRVDDDEVVVLRSCLMKPEHADIVPDLMRTLERQLDGLSPRPRG